MAKDFNIVLESLDSARIKSIIDDIFSYEWCRENLVVPVGTGTDSQNGNSYLVVAIGNFAYLATIGGFIKLRAQIDGYRCLLVDFEQDVIMQLLDQAAIV